MLKKSSGMQEIIYLSCISPQRISECNHPIWFTVFWLMPMDLGFPPLYSTCKMVDQYPLARTYLQLPSRQWGAGNVSVVQLKGKYCQKTHCHRHGDDNNFALKKNLLSLYEHVDCRTCLSLLVTADE